MHTDAPSPDNCSMPTTPAAEKPYEEPYVQCPYKTLCYAIGYAIGYGIGRTIQIITVNLCVSARYLLERLTRSENPVIRACKIAAVIITFPVLAPPLLVMSVAKVALDWILFPRQERFSYNCPMSRFPSRFPDQLSAYRLKLPPENPTLIGYEMQPCPQVTCRGTIVHFHGNGVIAADALRGYRRHTECMAAEGYRVICATYPGYDGSTGTILSEEDVIKAGQVFVDYAKTLKTDDAPELVLWGWSIGSGIAARLAADNAQTVTKIVLQAAYHDLDTLIQEKLPPCPGLRSCAHILRYNLNTKQDLLRFCSTSDKKEVVLLHAVNDSIIPFAHFEKIRETLRDAFQGDSTRWDNMRFYHVTPATEDDDDPSYNRLSGQIYHMILPEGTVSKTLNPPGQNRAAPPDAAPPDAASPDAASPDAASPDAASPDAAPPDAASPDAASPDAAPPDAASPDAASPDS